ncbi:hypothetical protein NA57DRAFT_41280 [Rhizodiscina lignyota]|uniref:DUF4139 domain-containing protein n=1 Tax=Rhizodiscina lignyota TaxID=1504668 RepID=A0A9P4M528_9PEZI|nr:hypothetical protein NA57DRAFT_41280 [Rhizodiscina lignyota]
MDIPKQEILVKDLPTKSVTLYPSRAHIVREIRDVELKPGPNEIEIYGVTPTADEQSVQIDGRGSATITDITVELVPNREIFQDVYPDADEPESEEEEPWEEEDSEEVKALNDELERLQREVKEATEIQNAAARRLETLDSYSQTMKADKNTAEDVSKTLAMYETERARIFKSHQDAAEKLRVSNSQISKKEKERLKAKIPQLKRFEQEMKARAKRAEKKQRQKEERRKEVERIKEERLKFWPKKVYRILVSLETASSIDTPASSRRGSTDSVTLSRGHMPDIKDPDAPSSSGSDGTIVSPSLSYVTRDASWSPRYDLNISSVQKSATIAYRAEFVNGTSETWKEAQLILSTSQTSYQGLEDKVPFMHAWHVRLGRSQDGGLLSPEELNKPRVGNAVAPLTKRNELFGSAQNVFTYGSQAQQQNRLQWAQQQEVQAMQAQSRHRETWKAVMERGEKMDSIAPHASIESAALFARGGGTFGAVANASSAFGSSVFGAAKKSKRLASVEQQESEEDIGEAMAFGLFDDGPSGAPRGPPTVGFQEAEWDDNGLTSTYEVPGMRTLAPSSLTRRHKIATLVALNIHLSYVAVPKLRPSAFLRAKIRNPSSSVTLLKGTAGVTLDGSFLGNMILGRVSPGQIFDLPLGVDPAVHVNYPKPSVHRSTRGLISKESAQVFSRSVWLTNTKTVPVELMVLDQVPISEDDRLKVDILQPKGLSSEGDVVRAGSAAKEGASGATASGQGNAWGKATATLKKDNQVAWTVTLEKKQACLLKLEYEARMPATERITAA